MKVLVGVFALLVFSTSAFAQTNWNHNGSVVTLHANGANRQFSYSVPRAGLPVKSGTVLFKGTKSGNTYSGIAYIFHSKCGARHYPVSGPVSDDQKSVTLYGQAPQVGSNCKVVDYRDDVLVFNFQEGSQVTTVANTFPLRIENDAPAMHIPVGYRGMTLHVRMAQDEHFVFMVEDALKALGKEQDILVLERPGLKNGFANLWRNFEGKTVKIIVYDPVELEHFRARLSDRTEFANAVSALFTLAHEVGHHVCNHLASRSGSEPWKEIEADRTAGAILARSDWRNFFGNASREDYETVMRLTLSPVASATHPGIETRIAAFREGWTRGRGCN